MNEIRKKPFWVFGIVVLMMSVALLSSGYLVWYDTALYHLSKIHWIHEFASVKGLSLLHSRLGFDSSWFVMSASFFKVSQSFSMISVFGGLIFTAFILQLVYTFKKVFLSKKAKMPDLFFIFSATVLILFILRYGMQRSPSPDLPVLILIIQIVWMILLRDSNSSVDFFIPVLFSIGALTIKTSALPLVMIVGLYYLFLIYKNGIAFELLAKQIILILLIVLPHLYQNYISSGCLLYPAHYFCMDVSWANKLDLVTNIAKEVRIYAH